MSQPSVPARGSSSRRFRALLPVVLVSLLLGGAAAGCSGGAGSQMPAVTPMAATSAPAAAASIPLGAMTMPTGDEVAATWQARPEFVTALPTAGQTAYAFALAHPDVLQWMPCYCGCAGIPHRSNLDCFFQRREVKGTYSYEEHASFCDICVKTANLAQQLLLQGKNAAQIRAAVDGTFGGGAAAGTDTPQPPSS